MSISQKLTLVLIGVISMLTPPALVLYIAISHNAQNEYVDESGKIEWVALIYLVTPSVIVGIALTGFIGMILAFIIKCFNQRGSCKTKNNF
jgi:hypothetical protein